MNPDARADACDFFLSARSGFVLAAMTTLVFVSAASAQPPPEGMSRSIDRRTAPTPRGQSAPLAPPNDDCGDAIHLGDGGLFAFDTTGATTDGGPSPACGPMESDIWFTIDGDWAIAELSVEPGGTIALYEPVADCPPTDADLLACGNYLSVMCTPPGTLLVRISTYGFGFSQGTLSVQHLEHCHRGGAPGNPMVVATCGPPEHPNGDWCLLWQCDCWMGCIAVPNDCDDDDICTRDACDEFCTHAPNAYGDLNHDDAINADDLAVVHSGVQSDFSTIPKKDIDLEPCNDANDVVNLKDALAVLRAMQGDPGCCGATADPPASADGGALEGQSADSSASLAGVGDALAAPAAAKPRVFWVPQGDVPADYASGTTRARSAPGEAVCAELWIQTDQPFDTAGVQVRIDGFSSPDGIGAGSIRAVCETAAVNHLHPAYAGFDLWTAATDQCIPSSVDSKITWLLNVTDPQDFVTLPIAPGALYLGEVCFYVTTTAKGEFTIEYQDVVSLHTMIATAGLTNWATVAFDPLTIVVRPPNDACSDALPISTGANSFDTGTASTDGYEGHTCGPLASDIWYTFTPECCGQLDVWATGGADVAIYQPGAACIPGDADLLACAAGVDGLSAEVTTAGSMLVRVGTDYGLTATGDLTLDLACTPFQCTIGLPPNHPTTNTECGGAPDSYPGMCELWYCDPATCTCSVVADEQAVTCDDGDVCTYDQCVGTVCTNTPAPYGDVDHNGVVGLFDIFCILDGVGGDFTECRFRDMDIEPCDGNGALNLLDVFAVLDVIAGIDPCCGG